MLAALAPRGVGRLAVPSVAAARSSSHKAHAAPVKREKDPEEFRKDVRISCFCVESVHWGHWDANDREPLIAPPSRRGAAPSLPQYHQNALNLGPPRPIRSFKQRFLVRFVPSSSPRRRSHPPVARPCSARYMEQSRIAYLHQLIRPHVSPEMWSDFINAKGRGIIASNLAINYKRPLEYPCYISVGTRIPLETIKNDRFEMHYALISDEDGALASDGHCGIVSYDYRYVTFLG